MVMPGRSFTSGTGYRFGFNGKEPDDEIKGSGNQIDYGMRTYDPRLARFLSVDPLTKQYPWYTPYQFAGNKPIWKIDIDGCEEGTPSLQKQDGQNTAAVSSTYTSPINIEAINAPKSGKPAVTIFDAVTAKITFGKQVGFEAKIAGKPAIAMHVNGGSKDVVGINKGSLVHVGQPEAPTTQGSSFGLGAFGVTAEIVTTEKSPVTEYIQMGSSAVPVQTQTTTQESTLYGSYGIWGLGASQTTQSVSNLGSGTMHTTITNGTAASVNYTVGVKASALFGVDINLDVPTLLQGLENLRKK